ncbi:SRPBCC family protein [Tsukamurella serpentis]
MAKVEKTVELAAAPDEVWSKAADLNLLQDWVTLHDGYRSDVPEELAVGTTFSSVVKVKGMRNRVDWTVASYQPPRDLVLDGKGVAGTKYKLTVSITPSGTGSKIVLRVDLGGPPLFGPVGATVARSLKGEIGESLDRLAGLVG